MLREACLTKLKLPLTVAATLLQKREDKEEENNMILICHSSLSLSFLKICRINLRKNTLRKMYRPLDSALRVMML